MAPRRPGRVLLAAHDGSVPGHTRRDSRISCALRVAGMNVEVTARTGVSCGWRARVATLVDGIPVGPTQEVCARCT